MEAGAGCKCTRGSATLSGEASPSCYHLILTLSFPCLSSFPFSPTPSARPPPARRGPHLGRRARERRHDRGPGGIRRLALRPPWKMTRATRQRLIQVYPKLGGPQDAVDARPRTKRGRERGRRGHRNGSASGWKRTFSMGRCETPTRARAIP